MPTQLETSHPCCCDGARPSRFTTALQRDRAWIEFNYRSQGKRRRRLRALSAEIRYPNTRAAIHAILQDPEHLEASRERDHHNPDRSIQSERCLLRRGRSSDAGLCACARPEVPGQCRDGDARVADNGSGVDTFSPLAREKQQMERT